MHFPAGQTEIQTPAQSCWRNAGDAQARLGRDAHGRAASEVWSWILSGKWRPFLLELSGTSKIREKGEKREDRTSTLCHPPSNPAHPADLFVALLQVEVQMEKAER